MKFLKKFATRAEYEAYMADNMENYPHVGYIADEGAVEYVKEAPPTPDKMPLHFEALEDLTVSFSLNAIEYSLDNQSWVALPADTATPTISAGSKVYFRASGLTPTSNDGIGTFSSTGRFDAVGNVMSMLYGAEFTDKMDVGQENAFCSLFKNCVKLENAKNLILPAMTLQKGCYSFMFNGCSNLISAPSVLPAETLAVSCYYYMFESCKKLVEAPEIAATTLANYCCQYMFRYCTSLVNAPNLPATTIANYCYSKMFYGCTNLINVPPILPATTLRENCYESMFYDCTNLVTAPILPALYFNYNCMRCYNDMFHGCSKLNYIKAMFIPEPSTSYTTTWVLGVASTGTFVKNAAATWNVTGSNGIPSGWNVETATE